MFFRSRLDRTAWCEQKCRVTSAVFPKGSNFRIVAAAQDSGTMREGSVSSVTFPVVQASEVNKFFGGDCVEFASVTS